MFRSFSRRFSRRTLALGAPNNNGFRFLPSTVTATPNSWGSWLQGQPAPVFKPNHRLHHLSTYIFGMQQEYGLSLDLCERWGYVLNVGYDNDMPGTVADAGLANPVTDKGKLLKLAIANPTKYPVAAAVGQVYPSDTQAPDGYTRDSAGVSIGLWSPEATPAAMAYAVQFKMNSSLNPLLATGVKVVAVYDGGETGLSIPDNATSFARDPRIVTAKGADSWVDYISRKKGEQQRQIYAEVKRLVPGRENYVYYPNAGNPYANIPGSNTSTWNWQEMKDAGDLPSGSVYYREPFSGDCGMGNPSIRFANSYYDQLTQWMAAVAEQIASGKPLSYSFVSAGYRHDPGSGPYGTGLETNFFLALDAYKGFLKCMYATGSVGLIHSHFSHDGGVGQTAYPAYDIANPPHWLLQQQAIGEVHARFSWLDEFIFDGDLLPGIAAGVIKSYYPQYEMAASTKIGDFYAREPIVRVFVRKLRLADKWLVVLWSPEVYNGGSGVDKLVYVREIPGVENLQYNARRQGSIYIVDKTSGSTVVTQMDLDDLTSKNFGMLGTV